MTDLPDYAAALRAAVANVKPIERIVEVHLDEASDRVLAEPVVADRDLPPFNRAQMDGYALRASELGTVEAFPVAGRVAAGQPGDVAVPPGACVAIATGAPLPDDVDTVIQHELSDRGDPVRFTIDSVEPGHAVHHRGSDAKQGDTLVPTRTRLAPQHLGIAASVGRHRLHVVARPRVTIITSGDEIKPIEYAVEPHQVRDSNGPMLEALLRRLGANVVGRHHVHDDRDETIDAVKEALEESDAIVTVGGVSAGERDFFPDAFAAHEVTAAVQGAAIQPGRPIRVGAGPAGHLVVALPGNPVSVLACTCLFVWPLLRAMQTLPPDLPWRDVELGEAVKPNPRRQAFRPARLDEAGRAIVPTWAGSGDLSHTAATDGLLALPVQADPVEAGARLRFLPWP